ncbi:MAG: hypothetical protein E7318_10750 [Clostridiales bacterium]|nr:hypothetical protein [Clostridiales bacterium]
MNHIKTMRPIRKRNLLCALIMLIMLVCQFLPYWNVSEGMSLSIQTYIWFPDYHKELTDTLLPLVEQFPCNHAVTAALPVMILCLAGLIICLRKSAGRGAGILPVLAGGYGLIAYLLDPVMRAGAGLWLHIVVLALMLLAGVWTMRAPHETE